MEKWRFIVTEGMSPAMNMAVDEAILQLHSEGKVPPTVRFYTWNPATLSIGYFQKAAKEINLELVQEKGIGFVRRATGGRAVLHDQELTYSVVVSESHPEMPSSVTEAYKVISLGLLHGFQNLGLDAEMVSLASDEEKKSTARRDRPPALIPPPGTNWWWKGKRWQAVRRPGKRASSFSTAPFCWIWMSSCCSPCFTSPQTG